MLTKAREWRKIQKALFRDWNPTGVETNSMKNPSKY
jgi:hypothetical protein